MKPVYNYQVTIARGSTTDAYGDQVDARSTLASAIPVSISKRNTRVFRDSRWVSLESYEISVDPALLLLQVHDLITDHMGTSYVVDSVSTDVTLVTTGSQVAQCFRLVE